MEFSLVKFLWMIFVLMFLFVDVFFHSKNVFVCVSVFFVHFVCACVLWWMLFFLLDVFRVDFFCGCVFC